MSMDPESRTLEEETGHLDSSAGPPLTAAVQRGELDPFGFVRSNRALAIGLAIVAISIFLMAFGPLIGPHSPTAEDFGATLTGPSSVSARRAIELT